METLKCYIYNANTGELVQEYSLQNRMEADQKVLRENKKPERTCDIALMIAAKFPPYGQAFDPETKSWEALPIDPATLPFDMKLVDGTLVPKSTEELVAEGVVTLDPRQKISPDGFLINKTKEELWDDGLLDIEEWKNYVMNEILMPRVEAIHKPLEAKFGGLRTQEIINDDNIAMQWLELRPEERGETAGSSAGALFLRNILRKKTIPDTATAKEKAEIVDEIATLIRSRTQEYRNTVIPTEEIRLEWHEKIFANNYLAGKKSKEILAEIDGENWPEVPPSVLIPEGTRLLDGTITLEDVAKRIDREIIHPGYDRIIDTVLSRWPRKDPFSWGMKQAQATAWLSSRNLSEAPMLVSAAMTRFETSQPTTDQIDEIAAGILEETPLYSEIVGVVSETRRKHSKAIAAIASDDTLSPARKYARMIEYAERISYPAVDEIVSGYRQRMKA